MSYPLNKNRQTKENGSQGPKLKILLNKRKHKRRDGLLLLSYSVSGDEDTDAS